MSLSDYLFWVGLTLMVACSLWDALVRRTAFTGVAYLVGLFLGMGSIWLTPAALWGKLLVTGLAAVFAALIAVREWKDYSDAE